MCESGEEDIAVLRHLYYPSTTMANMSQPSESVSMYVLSQTLAKYEAFFNQSDSRIAHWPLMASPWPLIAIMVSFLSFCTILGPKLMKNREAINLKPIMLPYNLAQAIFNAWLFHQVVNCGWFSHFSYRCQPVDREPSPYAMWVASGVWWYFFSKLTDLLDSVFFVLRKKFDHLTVLHLFHHTMMPINAWLGCKFAPGGHTTFIGLMNCFVHIVMYSYYFIAALGPQYQKYLWWKRHLTTLQLIQFVFILIHNTQLLFIECDYPKFLVHWFLIQTGIVMLLFLNFYHKQYRRPRQQKVKVENGHATAIQNGKLSNGTTHLNGTHHKNGSIFKNGTMTNGVYHRSVFKDVVVSSIGSTITNGVISN